MPFACIDVTGTIFVIQEVEPGAGIEYVDITNITPQPGVGWTTPDGGTTWNKPPPGSLLAAQASALPIVQQMAGTLAAQLAQAQADAATIQAWTPDPTVIPANVLAIFQRNQEGWVTLLEGLGNLTNSFAYQLGLSTPAFYSGS